MASNLSWRDHIANIAKSASKKLGVLFRFREYFSASQLLKIYVGLIRPCLEYCSHIWGASPYTYLLDRVESKAIRLIGDASIGGGTGGAGGASAPPHFRQGGQEYGFAPPHFDLTI